jgi:hypothetical protein
MEHGDLNFRSRTESRTLPKQILAIDQTPKQSSFLGSRTAERRKTPKKDINCEKKSNAR